MIKKNKKERRKTFGKFLAVVLAASMVMSMAACGSTESGKNDTETSQEEVATKIFTDSLGRKVEVPETITSVVPSGSLAQIYLYAVAPDLLIGISGAWSDNAEQYTDEKYLNLPEIGQFFGQHDLNYEEIVKMDPDIIIDVGETKEDMQEDMDEITEKTGIPIVHISANLDTMDEAYEMLGDLLGVEEYAQKLSDYCSYHYNRSLAIMEEVDADDARKELLYCVGEDGLNVIAKDSYHSEVIDLVSDNMAVVESPSSKGTGNEIDLEQLLKWNPETIIFGPSGYYDNCQTDFVWNQLKAMVNDSYYEVPIGPYNWMGFPPSSNRMLGLVWLTYVLYPEYVDYDIEEEIKEYYSLFYHCELTDEQYTELVQNSVLKVQE